MKKFTALFLAVLLCVAVLPLTASAAYENTHTNTGNQIEDLIGVAMTQIGYHEGNSTSDMGGTSTGSGNYTKYGKWYGINPGAWCAMFVSWCANQAGISASIIPKHASCDTGMEWFKGKSQWYYSKYFGGSYTPKRGDIIYFGSNPNNLNDSTHVGIVYAVDSANVYTIEGNKSDKCQYVTHSLNSSYIFGYGIPKYTSSSGGTTSKPYTLTFDPNGGTLTSGKSSYGIDYGDKYMTILGGSLPTATRSGYTFQSWYNEKYGYTLTTSTSEYFAVRENATFKAQWTKNSTSGKDYTMTFDPNGGTMVGAKKYGINYGDKYMDILGGVLPKATRSGYKLSSWYNEKYSYTLTTSTSEYLAVRENVTFKAQWTKLATYTVTYDANGGTGAPSKQTKTEDVTLTLRTGIPSRTGYTFLGWANSATATNPKYQPGGYFTENKNRTLYAVWQQDSAPDESYTLYFDPNGGTLTSGSSSYKISTGDYYMNVLGGSIPTASRTGYTFGSWYNEKYNYTLTDSTSEYYTIAEDATFKAQWTANTYKVNYNANGKSASNMPSATSIAYGTTGKLSSAVPTATGYTFAGWAASANGSVAYAAGANYTMNSASDVTLYAVWTASTYTLTFDPNGGTLTSGNSSYRISTGQTYMSALGGSVPTASRTGYTFQKWYNEKYDYTLTDSTTEFYAIAENATFKAQWTTNTYKVNYNANGKSASNMPSATSITYGTTGKLSSAVPTTDGYTFAGWATSAYGDAVYAAGADYTMTSASDVTLYAVWEKIPHTVHSWEFVSDSATCTDAGEKLYVCTECGATMTEASPALGHNPGEWEKVSDPDCTTKGEEKQLCTRCGAVVDTKTTPALGHSWGEWAVIKPATETETGLKTRKCDRCGAEENETVPVIAASAVEWTVEGYELVIRDAGEINTVRIAPGELTTSNDIRNAEGLRTFNQALITANTDDKGDLRIDLLKEGRYSMWVRYNDQKTYIISTIVVDPGSISPYIANINGITLKIEDINSNVRDIFIAPGTLTTYRECNDNKIVRLYDLANRAANNGRTYVYAIDYRNISPDGNYTMCVRYFTGRDTEITHFTIDYPTPEVTVNGLQITVSGLENIRNIRIAPGTYGTAAEVKQAEGSRLFSKNDKTLRNVAENGYVYTIQCREDGKYTLSIEYIGGYAEVVTVDVARLVPTVTLNGDDTVTLGDLAGLHIIRYAPGVITAQNLFKAAPGNKYFKPANVSPDGTVTTAALSGVWSFMIQYNEESFSIFLVDTAERTVSRIK